MLDEAGSADADVESHVTVVVNAVKIARASGAPEESTSWALERFGEKLRTEKSDTILRKWLRTVLLKGGLEIYKSVAGTNRSAILNEFASYVPAKYALNNSCSNSALNRALVTVS